MTSNPYFTLKPQIYIFQLQKIIVRVMTLNGKARKLKYDWVVGVVEVAGFLKNTSEVLDNSLEINLFPHPYYKIETVVKKNYFVYPKKFTKYIRNAFLFARLFRSTKGFVYISNKSFLIDDFDSREFEMKFLKKSGIKVVCIMTGADIRAFSKMQELERITGHKNYSSIEKTLLDTISIQNREKKVKDFAAVIDRYSDLIYSSNFDQLGYLKKRAMPIRYLYNELNFLTDFSRFDAPSKVNISHFPSSPAYKGSELIREAILKLKEEGFDFDYREATNLPNGDVLRFLRETHILVNELYGFMPGVLAIEGMASCCAVVTRADWKLETSLTQDAQGAWIVADENSIYSKLRELLLDPDLVRQTAISGNNWVKKHASYSNSGRQLNLELSALFSE